MGLHRRRQATPSEEERDFFLDAMCDVALGAVIPAVVFSVTARLLGVPLAGPLTMAGLLLGVFPVVGRAAWLVLVALLALLDAGGASALGTLLLVVTSTVVSERGARRLVRRWSGGGHAHQVRIALLVAGMVVGGLAGLVVALGLSPRRRAQRTRRRQRWLAGLVLGPVLLSVAVVPILAFPVQDPEVVLPPRDPAPTSQETQAVVLFVHGLGEAAGRPGDFDDLFDPLRSAFGRSSVADAVYYQDLRDRQPRTRSCRPDGTSLRAPAIPDDLHGMPIDVTTVRADKCDSESDLGLNVLMLSEQVRRLHEVTGRRVILVGYSMGGAIVRGLFTLSALRGDGVVRDDVDSVLLLHAVTQGSVLARNGGRIADVPVVGDAASDLFAGTIADPSRPAFAELAPRSTFQRWLAANARHVPPLPTFVTYGAVSVHGESCVLAVYVCVTTGTTQLGDGAVSPGTTDPADLPRDGGSRFLPGGPGPQSWEWGEKLVIHWDRQLDPLSLQLMSRLYHAPAQHFAVLSSTSSLLVRDCKTGRLTREDDELRRIVLGRMTGHPYLCLTATPGSGARR